MSEVIKPSGTDLGREELTDQVRYLLTACDNKPEALRALTEQVREELGDPPGRKNLLRIASSLAFPESTKNVKIMYQLMYVLGDQLLLEEGERSQLDLEKIDKNSEYRNEQYNRIVSRIKVVGAEESSLVNTCVALMKEYDFDLVDLDAAREWVKKQLNPEMPEREPFDLEKIYGKNPGSSSIPAPILEKDKGNKKIITDDEQMAIDELEAILRGETKPKEKVELGPSDNEEIKPQGSSLLARIEARLTNLDPYNTRLLFEPDVEEKVSFSPQELQEKAIRLKELEEEKKNLTTSGEFLSEKEGDRVEQIDKEKKEIDGIFERVFGSIKVNGLFAQAFHGVDYTIVDGIENHGKMVDLQKRLVQLGKECCLEGELDVRGKELFDIYEKAKDVLGKPNNNKTPKLSDVDLFDKFSDLVEVKGKMTYLSKPKELQKMAKELEQLELDRKANEEVDKEEIIRLDNVFAGVFGILNENGLFAQAFCGYDDIRDFGFDRQDEVYNLRTQLVQLGKDSCLEGKIVNEQQLEDIYVRGLHFRKNKRSPGLNLTEFMSKFKKLVTVEEKEV